MGIFGLGGGPAWNATSRWSYPAPMAARGDAAALTTIERRRADHTLGRLGCAVMICGLGVFSFGPAYPPPWLCHAGSFRRVSATRAVSDSFAFCGPRRIAR